MIPNMITKSCECGGLFYIDDERKTHCLPLTTDKCLKEYEDYSIRLYGTNQCLKNCTNDNYILSLDEQYCYNSDIYCPENTEKNKYKNENIANYQCFCSFKFYRDNNNKKRKKI